jgi:uncharacterized protein (UPF0333 family)
MLTKILVTALVIAACFVYLRHQKQKNAAASKQANVSESISKKNSISSQFQWLAGALIVLTACMAIGFFIYGWMDGHRVMTIKIINPQSGDVVSYQVYKGDLLERSFTTLQGQKVRISDSERIEITENP